jgi:zinc transport system permease protein
MTTAVTIITSRENVIMPDLYYAFIIASLASIAFGVIGTFVVTRRISSIAGAIAHSVLGGIGAALYFGFHPMLGAIITAIIAALVIGVVKLYAKQREDTIIGAIWAIGMAIGLLFIANTPGDFHLEDYLFGNIHLISRSDIYVILILDIVIVLPAILLFNSILGVCFDSHFSQLRGVRVKLIYFMLLIMTALTIVLMVKIVGIIMVIAMLTLPAATAGQFTKRLWSMILLSMFLSMAFTSTGLVLSNKINMPGGPTIVIIAGFFYLSSLIYKKIKVRS